MLSTPKNRFKEAIRAGRPQLGLWVASGDPLVTEICAGAGFDWLAIDAEHGPQHMPGILAQLQAMGGYPTCHPVVRVPSADPAGLKQYLDIGAQTLLVPMVETAEAAAAVVRACRYPPLGERGIGGARAAGWGRYVDYLEVANREVCVLVQVETVRALGNLDAILAVPDLDGVFIGPADLSASMGHLGNPSHPAVTEAVLEAIGRITAAGIPAGILTRDENLARQLLAGMAQFVAVGVETRILAIETSALAHKFRVMPELRE
jgi:4-hydroxy-2-oxoheptanedioate aldolase